LDLGKLLQSWQGDRDYSRPNIDEFLFRFLGKLGTPLRVVFDVPILAQDWKGLGFILWQ
jgi:hypothetical protein